MRMKLLAVAGFISASATAQVDTPAQLEPGIALAFCAARVEASRIQLTPPETKEFNKVIRDLRLGKNESAITRWDRFLDLIGDHPIDINALVQWVLRQSYIETSEDLRLFADKVKFFNSQKNAIRTSIRRARTFRALLKKFNQPTDVIDSEIESLRAYVARLNESSDLAEVDLQVALQKQQQVKDVLPKIFEELNSSGLAVICK